MAEFWISSQHQSWFGFPQSNRHFLVSPAIPRPTTRWEEGRIKLVSLTLLSKIICDGWMVFMHELISLPVVGLLRRLLTAYAQSRSSDYYTRVIELSSFIREWKIVSSFIQEWKMKYDLAIRWGKRQQVFCLTVRHAISHFYYVIAPADSYIRTTHFLGIIQFTPSCRPQIWKKQ